MTTLEDIKPVWLNVIRRLQSVARTDGFAVLSIRILVNAAGDPVYWTEPKRTKLEPKKCDELTIFLPEDDL